MPRIPRYGRSGRHTGMRASGAGPSTLAATPRAGCEDWPMNGGAGSGLIERVLLVTLLVVVVMVLALMANLHLARPSHILQPPTPPGGLVH